MLVFCSELQGSNVNRLAQQTLITHKTDDFFQGSRTCTFQCHKLYYISQWVLIQYFKKYSMLIM